MNSRLGVSALFILIGAMVIASQRPGLVREIKAFRASCADKISEVRTLPARCYSFGAGKQLRMTRTSSSDAKTNTFKFAHLTHCLSSNGRTLQRVVLNLIDSHD
jgi:hypothetical protein